MHYFYPKWVEIGRERARKKFLSRIPFLPDPGQKIPKKIAKKFKKHHSGIIFIKTEMRQAK